MSFTSQAVSEDEAALFRCVAVQVNVDLELADLLLLHYRSFGAIDCRLLFGARMGVKSVEVVVMCVQSVVTARNTIRINQRNHLESVSLQ